MRRTHLRDHDLTAERIAAAGNVSVRQLDKLWSLDKAVGLAEWIVDGRLEGARRELAHPAAIRWPSRRRYAAGDSSTRLQDAVTEVILTALKSVS